MNDITLVNELNCKSIMILFYPLGMVYKNVNVNVNVNCICKFGQ